MSESELVVVLLAFRLNSYQAREVRRELMKRKKPKGQEIACFA